METHDEERSPPSEGGRADDEGRDQAPMRRAVQGHDHAPGGQNWAPNGDDPGRGSMAWLERMEERGGRTQSRWARQDQAIGSKRMRALSSQEGDRERMSAKAEREDNEAEQELLVDLSNEAWAQIEQGFSQTNMQVCFSMNETSVPVSSSCSWQLVDFTPEIITHCSNNGVDFEGEELLLETKDQQYLKGNPVKQDRVLWQVLKRGYIPISIDDTAVRIWIQPAYTGIQGSNLSLNELEYYNGNYVSPAQLRSAINEMGGSDCLVVSHSTYMNEKQRWTPVACMRYAATSLAYSFRLYFPSPNEANKVYRNYLLSSRQRRRRRDKPADTINLRLVQNTEWDTQREAIVRLTKTERDARNSKRINVYGVTSEVKMIFLKEAFERAGFQPQHIRFNRGRSRSAVATFNTTDQAKAAVERLGENGPEQVTFDVTAPF
ncbi:hypothetical protein PR001_g14797 [Phytophthora rubi]|uniref:RRM domain-containing protein n=1 Tax=Phytophthora rubi TaxID=129364 RepID=A0A6A3KZJ3_9STRA|nr:hypothetical protein PR002_g15206 [Phytophthora rubi]KAE9015850.1 hypothetical protein PR001_g14797 [Phytophthora rubi]